MQQAMVQGEPKVWFVTPRSRVSSMPVSFLAGPTRPRTSGSELEFELEFVADRDPAEAEERDLRLELA
jgi:hypothetical protein